MFEVGSSCLAQLGMVQGLHYEVSVMVSFVGLSTNTYIQKKNKKPNPLFCGTLKSNFAKADNYS